MIMKISGALCVVAVLAIVAAFIFAPNMLHNSIVALIFLICPISMILMMWSMKKS